MDEDYSVIQFLPEPLRTELKAMPPERAARVQEIRLRAGQAVQFTVGGAWQPAQQLLPAAQTALAIGPRMLRSCFSALCRDSAYAYEDELKQGYFTLPGGSRVGVAGVCGPAGFADITSLNLRVARQVPCVLPPQLRRTLDALNGGILVVGTPGSGKPVLPAGKGLLCPPAHHLPTGDGNGGNAGVRGELPQRIQYHAGVHRRGPGGKQLRDQCGAGAVFWIHAAGGGRTL